MIKYFLIPLIIFCFACSPDTTEFDAPIPREKLVEIIAESLIMEPAGREFPSVSQDSIYELHYSRILDQRGFSTEDFISSMQWLQKDPKKLEAIYEEVLEHLQVIETEISN